MIRIRIPWPPRELSPNSRVHFRTRAPITKAHREQAFWLTIHTGAILSIPDGPTRLTLTFHPPDKRRYDLDGLLSRAKCQIDGVADALGVNDFKFEFLIRRAEPVKGGCVDVTVEPI